MFSIAASGRSRVLLDGQVIVDNWTAPLAQGFMFGAATKEQRAVVTLEAGMKYAVAVEFARDFSFEEALPTQTPVILVNFGLEEVSPHPGLGEAVDAAAWADIALVFCGTGPEWESEGFDKDTTALPGDQDELIVAVAAANPRCIVVVDCGSVVAMPWIDMVAATILALFPGEKIGNALADVVFSTIPPGGKLPFTIPKRIEDSPAYPGFFPESGNVFYTDRVFVGYRYFDTKGIDPLFCFGHGLSYGEIDITDCKISLPDVVPSEPFESLQRLEVGEGGGTETYFGPPVAVVEGTLENRGKYRGSEVVQVYIRDPRSAIARPNKELKGFARVELDPGENTRVFIPLERRDFQYYDTSLRKFVAPGKEYEILVGFSSRDIRSRLAFELD